MICRTEDEFHPYQYGLYFIVTYPTAQDFLVFTACDTFKFCKENCCY